MKWREWGHTCYTSQAVNRLLCQIAMSDRQCKFPGIDLTKGLNLPLC